MTNIGELESVLRAALDHQVSNLGTKYEFYTCYTYDTGVLPQWAHDAKRLLGVEGGRKKVPKIAPNRVRKS